MRFILSFLLFCGIAQAQVGIGTANPDPSSLLDVSSTTQGMLTPRMTLAQIQAISNPAQGLLVFNTDLERFFFYEGTDWVQFGTAESRNKFRLIKDISDLSLEDTGTVYRLQTGFLYEINGIIDIDKPIDLNGAYIEGRDTGEDVIRNATSGQALFEGATSGSLRNLTLNGDNQQVFNLNGTGSQNIIVNNCVISNSSSVGSISNFNTAFLSIVQYINNVTGLSVSDITSCSMSNIYWTATNQGTFLTVSGTFNNFLMSSGRVESNPSEIGLDVSSNPVIQNDATLSEISFVGDGTPVLAYTSTTYPNFNFSNDWNVRCSGIPVETDGVATANFYNNNTLATGFGQNILSETPVEVQGLGSFLATDLFRFESTDGNTLIYRGKKTRNVRVGASLSVRVEQAVGNFYAFAIAKNGSMVVETKALIQVSSNTQIQNLSLNGVLTVDPGDRIEVYVQRLNGTGTDLLAVFSENLSVR